MANQKTATLTHKVRNPQNIDEWLDIWNAEVKADFEGNNRTNEQITIRPTSNWKIPISNLINESGSNDTLPGSITADHIKGLNGNVLVKTDSNGKVNNGPQINENGSILKVLNEKGNWSELTANNGIKITANNSNIALIEHTNTITAGETAGSNRVSEGKELDIPYVAYDSNGHITQANTYKFTVTGFLPSTNNSADIPTDRVINLENFVRTKTNTRSDDGVVLSPNRITYAVWRAGSNSENPAWGKINQNYMATDLDLNRNIPDNSFSSSKLDTKLLGVWISDSSHLISTYSEKNQQAPGDFDNLDTNWDQTHCGIWVEI